jgi:hypothetical protein
MSIKKQIIEIAESSEKMSEAKTRSGIAGEEIARSLIEISELMYNKNIKQRFLTMILITIAVYLKEKYFEEDPDVIKPN